MKRTLAACFGVAALAGCWHHVEVTAPEPITINMNVKIEHEIRVKVDKELEDAFAQDKDTF